MDSSIERYLNDHLAGSAGAVKLIQTLVDRSEREDCREFFQTLHDKVEKDRVLLKDLISRIGTKHSTLLQMAGSLTEKVGKIKFHLDGLDSGELGSFEAIEVLSLGIQGKRLLWVLLGKIQPWFPEWAAFNFNDLELEAIAQRDSVEALRLEAGIQTFVDRERRSDAFPHANPNPIRTPKA